MTVAKSQISLFILIWVAVTTVLAFPVQAASLNDTPFPTTEKQIKPKNTAVFTSRSDLIDTQNIYVNDFCQNQPNCSSELPLSPLYESIAQLEEVSEVTQETVGDKIIYTYNANITSNQSPIVTTYSSNRWQVPKVPPRRRVPESSPIVGLLMFISLLISKKVKIKT